MTTSAHLRGAFNTSGSMSSRRMADSSSETIGTLDGQIHEKLGNDDSSHPKLTKWR